nr:UDP-N-acetylglucosamine acyltransferase [Actinoalloteichus spitiensis]
MTNRIHPSSVVSPDVEFGEDNVIGPFCVITGPTRIGDGNWIGPHSVIGTPAEYRSGPHPIGWDGEVGGGGVVIGDRTVVREFTTINQGTTTPTRVGDECYLMSGVHLGHDSVVGNRVTLASAVQVAGHCVVWDEANLGMGALLHQRSEVGPGAMVGMGAVVRRTVAAFTIAVGDPARTTGINEVGLRRQGCGDTAVEALAPLLRGTGPLPAGGLPTRLAELLRSWADREQRDAATDEGALRT